MGNVAVSLPNNERIDIADVFEKTLRSEAFREVMRKLDEELLRILEAHQENPTKIKRVIYGS
jgi:hypothetical protein